MSDENRNAWSFGFNTGAENWNGRLAMIGFVSALAIELISGQGVLHFFLCEYLIQPQLLLLQEFPHQESHQCYLQQFLARA